nr:hypothetical protein [Actinomadura sp. CNU-125]
MNEREQFGGRQAAHLPHVPAEVRLVRVPAGHGRRGVADQQRGALEPGDPRDRLGRQPDVPPEPQLQVPEADPQVARDPADRTGGGLQPPPGPQDQIVRTGRRRREPRRQPLVEDVEPRVPPGRFGEPVREPRRPRAEDVRGSAPSRRRDRAGAGRKARPPPPG